jgi:hypothetical protein
MALKERSGLLGRTTTTQSILLSTTIDLKADLQRRLNKLRSIAFPYLFETISPILGLELLVYLNDKSPKRRDLEAPIIFENSDEESEYFN